ncbi:hypothetical protein HK102_000166 [Quaeritorhiza haematococci]|nr:hypothetical protein HK102_000166 [Quaeritorhiza haematococci]
MNRFDNASTLQIRRKNGDDGEGIYEVIRGALYLGNWKAAANQRLLDRYGIKTVVNCTTSFPNYFPDKYRYYNIPVMDSPDEESRKTMLEGCKTVIRAFPDTRPVLVHCQMGISRSSTVVLLILRRYFFQSMAQALGHLLQVRPKAFWGGKVFNFEFVLDDFYPGELKAYEPPSRPPSTPAVRCPVCRAYAYKSEEDQVKEFNKSIAFLDAHLDIVARTLHKIREIAYPQAESCLYSCPSIREKIRMLVVESMRMGVGHQGPDPGLRRGGMEIGTKPRPQSAHFDRPFSPSYSHGSDSGFLDDDPLDEDYVDDEENDDSSDEDSGDVDSSEGAPDDGDLDYGHRDSVHGDPDAEDPDDRDLEDGDSESEDSKRRQGSQRGPRAEQRPN